MLFGGLFIIINVNKSFRAPLNQTYELTFIEQHQGLVIIKPQNVHIQTNNQTYPVIITGVNPGSITVTGQLTPNDTIRYTLYFSYD